MQCSWLETQNGQHHLVKCSCSTHAITYDMKWMWSILHWIFLLEVKEHQVYNKSMIRGHELVWVPNEKWLPPPPITRSPLFTWWIVCLWKSGGHGRSACSKEITSHTYYWSWTYNELIKNATSLLSIIVLMYTCTSPENADKTPGSPFVVKLSAMHLHSAWFCLPSAS